MTLMATEIKEIRRHLKHFEAGKIDINQVKGLVMLYAESDKRVKNAITLMGIAQKMGDRSTYKRLCRVNLIDDTVIDLSPEEIEEEKIFCPLQKEHITRAACLDYSGEEENHEDCKECDAGLKNKKLLVGRPMYTA